MQPNQKYQGSSYTIFVVLLVIFLAGVGRYGYMYVMNYQTSASLQSFNADKTEKEAQLARIKAKPTYRKYQAAKSIDQTVSAIPWSIQMRIIKNMLTILERFSTNTMELSDFKVSLSTMGLKGKVTDLQFVYGSGGVIDTFIRPNLVKGLRIKDYQKLGDYYEFILQANINIDGIDKSRTICR